MPLDTFEEHRETDIEFYVSEVVEAIALAAGLTEPSRYTHVSEDHTRLWDSLSAESQEFLTRWQNESPLNLLSLVDVMQPLGEYRTLAAFVKLMNACSDIMFLYHFFETQINPETIQACLDRPDRARFLLKDTHLDLYVPTHGDFLIAFFRQVSSVRNQISHLFREIAESTPFLDTCRRHQQHSESAITWARSLRLEPLQLAQRLMGKNFWHVSAYTRYTFIPSHFISPRRVRVFDSQHCMVIFGWDQAATDPRATEADLEKQTKALADANRIAMLRVLAHTREYGARLAEYLGLTGATVSHHLDVLKQAGFIREEKVGNIKYFSLHEQNLEDYLQRFHHHIRR